ncbi:DEAD/DEAH box helicase [Beggiatoa leptomitoformis]|uniref:Helicase n=1 Tax=Beggiatoa leptomitoformis TaxID=288004 RepID=A0A2N9YHY2_9GAMM|nr:DEAD/DEAH box helicase [Beggiatoa leptomitoformis]AUI70110.1 helicase [Beggiatoa leptomitoformis]QGX03636.1 helicase [Beggiatoa leptomitoformis]
MNNRIKATSNTKKCLLYLLSLKLFGDTNKTLVVEVVSAQRSEKGSYSNINPASFIQRDLIMSPDDSVIISQLRAINQVRTNDIVSTFSLMPTDQITTSILLDMLKTNRCHWENAKTAALTDGKVRTATLKWTAQNNKTQILHFTFQGDTSAHILPLMPLWYVDTKTAECGELITGLPNPVALMVSKAPTLKAEEATLVCAQLENLAPTLDIPKPFFSYQTRQENDTPKIHLHLFSQTVPLIPNMRSSANKIQENIPFARLTFQYKNRTINALESIGESFSYLDKTNEVRVTIKRDLQKEDAAKQTLHDLQFVSTMEHPDSKSFFFTPQRHTLNYVPKVSLLRDSFLLEEHLSNFFLTTLPALQAEGWEIEIDKNYQYNIVHPEAIEEWYGEIDETTGIDWFSLSLGIKINGKRINLLPLLVQLLKKVSTTQDLNKLLSLPDDTTLSVRLEDKRLLPIAISRIRNILSILVELLDYTALDSTGRLQLNHLQAAQLIELEASIGATQLRWLGGDKLLALGRKLQYFQGIKTVKLPSNFHATLRPYQQQGVNWLQFLREYQLAGILADDMGLGKTVQTLGHIAIEKQQGRLTKPCLIIAPTSLMGNWRAEAQRFVTNLSVLVLQGLQRKEQFEQISTHDLILTTYPLLARDKEFLLKHEYHLLILDEAQNIKNPSAKSTLVAHQIKANHRLCLTGTPLENHLGEIWSLFHFLMPGLLGTRKHFHQRFRKPIEKEGNLLRHQALSRRIKPFMLRRTKELVIAELPEKNEIVRMVEMEGAQLDLYETIRLAMHDKVRKEIAEKGMARSQLIILDALLKLRQVCCDPRLVSLSAAKKVKQSAKLNLLMDLVPEMIEEGRKILIFSQFTSMLALIEEAFQQAEIPYVILTGQTQKRTEIIARFQDGDIPVFLISLKAGGTGLNLTAADTVIHYDPWWNPAVEEQATDRAHRIGQEKTVFVYKFITAGTVEEKIQALQERKKQLADALFAGTGQGAVQLSLTDLDALFEPLVS